MARTHGRGSEFEDDEQDPIEDPGEEFEVREQEEEEREEEEKEEIEEETFAQPPCPRCGWHNTRPSHMLNLLDHVFRMFTLRPYRCRSCGNRFRTRPPKT